MARPLQFAPGERYAYSNFGYCVLGRVLEKAMNKTWFECVQESICQPLRITDIKLGHSASSQRDPREVWYPSTITPSPRNYGRPRRLDRFLSRPLPLPRCLLDER